MLNKNKAFFHYFLSSILAILSTMLFSILLIVFNDTSEFANNMTISKSAGVTFGFSLLIFILFYSLMIFLFVNDKQIIKTIIPIIISTIILSLIIAIIEWCFYFMYGKQTPTKPIFTGCLAFLFSIASILLILLQTYFNTKFILSSTSKRRSDEWEYSNFMNLFLNRISIQHYEYEGFSHLKSKDLDLIVKFIDDDEISRKISISNESPSKIIEEIIKKLKNDQIGAIVYLSNILPIIEGENEKIYILKNNELFKKFKEKRKKND
ncbi:MAG: hypothetical protein TYPL_2830 [Candidatus Tyloplasma litorale]|nr:MAG: hypothetical protein TYPL_2830 [Mycoplasmatales bacterium]